MSITDIIEIHNY